MKRNLTLGIAVIAFAALPAANASEDSEYAREGWAALDATQSSARFAVPPRAADAGAPFEQTQFDRGAAMRSGTQGYAAGGSTVDASSANVWAKDPRSVAPAP